MPRYYQGTAAMRRTARSISKSARAQAAASKIPFAPVRHHFDSVHEYCTATPATQHQGNVSTLRELQHLDGTWNAKEFEPNAHRPSTWLGAPTFQAAAARVTHGWPEGAERVRRNMADIEINAPMSVKRRRSRADQGDELDIHRVYRGDLAHAWSARTRREVRSPLLVRIVVQTNLLAATAFEDMFWRGAACAKFADLLVDAGYNVEIIGAVATESMGGRDGEYLVTFPLKEATAPLDIESLCGVVCNAAFHRMFGFRMYQYLANVPMRIGGAASNRDGAILRKHYGPEATVEDGFPTFITPYDIFSIESATAWVRSCVELLNDPTS